MIDKQDIDLVQKYFLGGCSDEEFQELSKKLKQNKELRKYYRQEAERDILYSEVAASSPIITDISLAEEPKKSLAKLPWIAAALFLSTSLVLIILLLQEKNTTSTFYTPTLAILQQSEALHWSTDSTALQEQGKVSQGVLSLEEGSAHITLHSGIKIVLEGKTKLELYNTNSGKLHYGQLVFHDESEHNTFHLTTPHSTMLDLGTTYRIQVDQESEEVHVSEGEVWRMLNQSNEPSSIIAANESKRFGPNLPFYGKNIQNEAIQIHTLHQVELNKNTLTFSETFQKADGKYSGEDFGHHSFWAEPWQYFRRNTDKEIRNDVQLNLQNETLHIANEESHTYFNRKLAMPIHLNENKDMWYHVKVKFNRLDDGKGKGLNFWMNLRSSGENTSNADYLRFVTLINPTKGSILTRTMKHAKTKKDIKANVWYHFVCKLEAREYGLDQFLIYLTDTTLTEPPKKWDLSIPMIKDHGFVDTLGFHFGQNLDISIDDIQLSTSWQSLQFN